MQTPMARMIQSHYLNDLFFNLFQKIEIKEKPIVTSHISSVLDAPIAYLQAHLAEKISLLDVAQACGMSVSSLESKFKALTGTSAYGYLISLRMTHAMRLLSETAYSVTEIASRCGYDNLFYFCNAFKKHIGITPGEYRKQNLI